MKKEKINWIQLKEVVINLMNYISSNCESLLTFYKQDKIYIKNIEWKENLIKNEIFSIHIDNPSKIRTSRLSEQELIEVIDQQLIGLKISIKLIAKYLNIDYQKILNQIMNFEE